MNPTLYPARTQLVGRLGRRGQVLAGMWAGKGMKEIAADLGISAKTVEYHRAQLYRRFGVGDPVSLCRRAIVLGLIKPDVGRGAKTESRKQRAETGRRDNRSNDADEFVF
jgi:two-component system, LuxR family, response regulator FixJ